MIKNALLKAVLLTITVSLIPSSIAAPITTTALGHNSPTKYIDAPYLPYANPKAPSGGTLSLDARGTFNSANKWMTTGVAMIGTDYLYDTLMTGSLNEAFTMYPQLASKVTYDPDDTSWIIYHLNPNARFWDGSGVTSRDVKATFEAILNKGPMYIRSYLSDIKDIQIINDQQVKFVFASAENKEILLTVGQFPIFAKSSIDADFEKISLSPLMGSGPYKLGRVDAGRSVSYIRDPNYWGRDLMVNRGRYNFDMIKFVYYQSDEIAFEGFKSGQYRFRPENKASNWVTGYNFPAVKAGLIQKETITSQNPVPMQALVMNLRRPIFQDIKVRQALTAAYDFEWMNKTLFHGQYERLQSFFHGSELAATGTPSDAEMQVLTPLLSELELTQREATLAEWQLPTSDGNGFNRQGLLEARQLLLEAGFYYEDMKLYQLDGSLAQIEILMTGETMGRVLLPYIRNLKRLGFDATLRQVDGPQYYERMRRFDYDMVVDVFAQSLSPGAEQAAFWGSAAADEPGNHNSAGIKNAAVDKVVAALGNAKNRDEIVLYTQVLDRLLRAGHYVVPLYGKSGTNVAYWDQYRHTEKLPTNAVGIDYWWVDKEAEGRINKYLKQ
ncbi:MULTISPECIES: extracellular solute-binding protein [Psychrobacter]|uniref:extracellular solute-binding protein n=1 Tax=Psychrobacter TaxID=497 RepID=UPI000C33D55A|nr:MULTISPECIES: extracellular solute-binding protein [Psychrobacter]MBA6243122.1 ABC transporter substrate-binding protein [Psychrobacter sp. Urea-trap-18]MBA6286180.1 ABC transporter substrate-binding protein [Psychrobacter sp. Urea-trap-16]MBA6317329.1 ABC transporter substrate-binding protein [Psychrobacter sp. Urea-trap-20]MBA6334643.1 ABC transporter substrate-binding protein [Psychrobacter sp. Urea-trap-19]PKG60965.1 ABC transporter substrate-binding protein [Psychrobacter sp. Choline-3